MEDVVAKPGQPITVAAVAAALDRLPQVDIIAMVHAEAANGALNPLAGIAELARARGALLVVDAVASVGGHAIDMDGLGIDIVVIGAQKGLGGPSGISAAAVSARAWAHIAATPHFSPSSLSLADIKELWLDRGRGLLPGMPPPLEFWALEAALDRVEAEGLEQLIGRHELARRASRAGLYALGVRPWIAEEAEASALVTTAPVPDGIEAGALIEAAGAFGVTLARGVGDISSRLVRLDHSGPRATFGVVLANIVAYGSALAALGGRVNVGAAAETVANAYLALGL